MTAIFDWDPVKDEENQRKHGVPFSVAQLAFLDPQCLIARDPEHSFEEERFYCIGKIADQIVTVRFTYRPGAIRIIGAGYWRKGRKIYEANPKIH